MESRNIAIACTYSDGMGYASDGGQVRRRVGGFSSISEGGANTYCWKNRDH